MHSAAPTPAGPIPLQSCRRSFSVSACLQLRVPVAGTAGPPMELTGGGGAEAAGRAARGGPSAVPAGAAAKRVLTPVD